MGVASVWELRTYIRDRDGGQADTRIYLPALHSFDTALAFATTVLGPRVQALSNGVWYRSLVIRSASIDNPPPPGDLGTHTRKALCLWRNDDDRLASFSIYAPNPNIFVADGPGAGLSVDPAALADLTDALSGIGALDYTRVRFGSTLAGAHLAY